MTQCFIDRCAFALLMTALLAPSITLAEVPSENFGTALEAFTNAVRKNDAAGMASFFYAKGAADQQFAVANARRIVSAVALQDAIRKQVDPNGVYLVRQFGLIDDDLDILGGLSFDEHDDTAVGIRSGPESRAVWFKRISGAWKQDITPAPPLTIAGRTQDMTEDALAVERVTADIEQGKLKTLPHVRDALGTAMLNAAPDGNFVNGQFRIESEDIPSEHDRPDPHGQFPTAPTTPAGAMNRFIHAIEGADAATLRDAIEMPKDNYGTGRAAVAQDLIVGYRLMQAVQAKFSDPDTQGRICFWTGVLQPGSLRDYTDDEWATPSTYPDLALGDGATVLKTVVSNGQKVVVHEMDWVPVMHRGSDGLWRVGPRFPASIRQLQTMTTTLAARKTILQKAAVDIQAGQYSTDAELLTAVMPGLQALSPYKESLGKNLLGGAQSP